MRHLKPLLLSLAVAGCSATLPTTPLPRGSDGLEAVRFVQTVRFQGALGNSWEFAAGTVLVADRRRDEDGQVLYCGPMVIRDLATETRPTCVTLDGDRIFINTEYLRRGFERQMPAGAIVPTRLS